MFSVLKFIVSLIFQKQRYPCKQIAEIINKKQNNYSLSILWHCLSLELEQKLNFSSPVATAEFFKFAGILSTALSQHHLLGFEIAQLEFHHLY